MTFVELTCEYCGKKFLRRKAEFNQSMERGFRIFCSHECQNSACNKKQKFICPVCGKEFERKLKEIKKSKTGWHFCSKSCVMTWKNTHKTKGIKVSKLELWLQEKLPNIYPDLKFEFNNKDAINSELDIYIPELKLAFELNGIYHYEPIHGKNRLEQIQNNDDRKFAACSENNISLCVIDTSGQNYFKEETSIRYLDIIKGIIDKNLWE
jgi:YHS domain-containing protein